MMRSVISLTTILLAMVLFACGGDDDPGITDEQRQLVMGESTGNNILFSDFASPLVLANENIHSNLRELDLNNDGVIDVTFRAYQDFFRNRGLIFSTVNDSTRVSMVDQEVKALEEGNVITIETESWAAADQVPLAEIVDDNATGNWNMIGRRYVAVRMDIGNRRFLTWIELSVEDYDNYTFYNVATKSVP